MRLLQELDGYVDRDRAADAAGVENTRALGERAGNWLTAEQAKALLLAPDENTLKGKRDRAILAVLVGCGGKNWCCWTLKICRCEKTDG